MTASDGTPTARGDYTESLSGLELEIDVGAPNITSNPTVQPTGLSATSAVGAITPPDQVMGLTGVSATFSVGSITPVDQVMGLTGQEATTSLGQIGGPIAWGKVEPSQGGSWSKRTPTQGGSWTKRTA